MKRIRQLWLLGTITLLMALGLALLDARTAICMAVGAVGLSIMLVAQILEVRSDGLTADAIEHFAQTVFLAAFIVGFFFNDIDWVLLLCFVCGFIALIISFGAHIAHLSGETKALWRRWKAWKQRD